VKRKFSRYRKVSAFFLQVAAFNFAVDMKIGWNLGNTLDWHFPVTVTVP
jgi:hypothetical protein